MHRTLATLLVLALPSALPAQTVDLVFEPPVLSSAPICDRNLSDEALVAKWEGADSAAPSETDTGLIKRDLRRLIELQLGDPALLELELAELMALPAPTHHP